MADNDLDTLMNASEACEYLAQKWGVESYSLVAFRSLRHRYNIKPALAASTATFWRKSDLDKIPKPDRSAPRPRRKKAVVEGENEDGEGLTSSVMLKDSGILLDLAS